MRRFSAVLFDFDGTLADTAADVWDSVRYGFSQLGLELPDAYAHDDRNLAKLVEVMVSELYPQVSDDVKTAVSQAVSDHYRNISTYTNTVFYPGIENALELLQKNGIPVGILSNKGHLSLGRILKMKGWLHYFTSYCGTSDTDDSPKTERLASYSKNFDLTNSVYIGDSASDIYAARANGLPTIGVLYGDGDSEDLIGSRPDVVLASSEALYRYFKEGN